MSTAPTTDSSGLSSLRGFYLFTLPPCYCLIDIYLVSAPHASSAAYPSKKRCPWCLFFPRWEGSEGSTEGALIQPNLPLTEWIRDGHVLLRGFHRANPATVAYSPPKRLSIPWQTRTWPLHGPRNSAQLAGVKHRDKGCRGIEPYSLWTGSPPPCH